MKTPSARLRWCNLAVHMYRGDLGAEIEERLTDHSAVLHRWLDVLIQRAEAAE
ncbi:MAG: hypothetical protein WB697_17630 [Stellaceae bacterium]